jgi:hypothetical protein
LFAIFTAFDLDHLLDQIDLAECAVGKQCIKEWWLQHQRKDAIREVV